MVGLHGPSHSEPLSDVVHAAAFEFLDEDMPWGLVAAVRVLAWAGVETSAGTRGEPTPWCGREASAWSC